MSTERQHHSRLTEFAELAVGLSIVVKDVQCGLARQSFGHFMYT